MIKMKHLLIAIVATVTFSCGGAPQSATSSSGGGEPPVVECIDNNCFQAKPQKVESIMNHRQIIPSMQKCLALTSAQVSTAARAAFKEALPSFSLNGDAKDVSAPLMMSLLTVASEMCLSRIEVERTQNTGRLYFPGINLQTSGSNNNVQALNLNKTVQDLAKSCWGREITSAELNLITKNITGTSNRATALYACTAVLSSTQAIRF